MVFLLFGYCGLMLHCFGEWDIYFPRFVNGTNSWKLELAETFFVK